MKKIIFFSIADAVDPHNHPALGLGFIKAYILKQHAGLVEVKIVRENIEEVLKQYQPDLVGISSVTQFYTLAVEFAKKIRHFLPAAKICVGGTHITSLPESLDEVFDFGIIREGEITFSEVVGLLVRNCLNKNNLSKIKGVVFRDDKNQLVRTPERELIVNLDEVPHIDWDDYNPQNFAHIITSRGCPYACAFCASTHIWGTRKVRYNSAQYVYEEIKALSKRGVRHISIWDDLFAFNLPRLREIITLLWKDKSIRSKITFGCTARANIVNDELCKLLKYMNVRYVSMGLESGSEKVLSKIKGAVTVEDNKRAVRILHKWGFVVKGSFVINNPDESVDDLECTYNMIKNIPLDGGDVNIAIPLPGTPYWQYAKNKGLVKNDMDFSLLNIKNNLKILTEKDFIKLSDEATHEEILKWGIKIQDELHKKELWSFGKLVNMDNFLIALKNPAFACRYVRNHALDFLKKFI